MNKFILLLLVLLTFSDGIFASRDSGKYEDIEHVLRVVDVKMTDDLSEVLSGDNSKYIIRDHYDLSRYPNGVTVGKNCELDFQGGSLNNGIIIFNNTKIKSNTKRIFDKNRYAGRLDNVETYPEWFGAVGDGDTDDTKPIQDAMDVSNRVAGLADKIYAVKTNSPNKHCLIVRRDSLSLYINLKDINKYTTSDYRGKGVVFIDSKNEFTFIGNITSVNDSLPVSAKTGMTLENSRAGIVCHGDCGGEY